MSDTNQNPYVGPRSFQEADSHKFFGREIESRQLTSLIIAHRVVLFYAQSGAGKTSLLQASVMPTLKRRRMVSVLPISRVGGDPPPGIAGNQIKNIYVFNALLNLEKTPSPPEKLAELSLPEGLQPYLQSENEGQRPHPHLLILDQFEELFTHHPERYEERADFFSQLRDCLEAYPYLSLLLAMREEYIAELDFYSAQMPDRMRTRFRIEFMTRESALEAVGKPASQAGRPFEPDVAEELVDNLRRSKVTRFGKKARTEKVVMGKFVEPVHLQIVCHQLWESLPPDRETIRTEDVRAFGNVDQALALFYEDVINRVSRQASVSQRHLRTWFDEQLVTPAQTRGLVFRGERETAGLVNEAVDRLNRAYLIRSEIRHGATWYELSHDRFIAPIQQSNQEWLVARQTTLIKGVIGLLILLIVISIAFSVQSSLETSEEAAARAEFVATTTAVASVTQAAIEASNATATQAQATAQATNATAIAEVQATQQAEVAKVVQQAEGDVALSKSRQLAAEALLEEDSDLALLLGIEANRQADTQEARKSLHKILSSQATPDGSFLRRLEPGIFSPRILARLEEHADASPSWVLSVAISPDGRRLVSGSADDTLILWDVSESERVGDPLAGHTGNVFSVAWSPDGRLASSSEDRTVIVWDLNSGQPAQTLRGHSDWVTSVAWSPDGRLASASADNTVIIWDLENGRPAQTLTGHLDAVWSVAWSPDGRFLASGSADSTVRIWNAQTFSEVPALRGHRGLIRSIAWSPDSSRIASGSVVENEEQMLGEVILWDVDDGQEIDRPLRGSLQQVRTVAFDPKGTILAIGQDNNTITLWDVENSRALGAPLRGHESRVMSIAFSPDGRYMASGSIDETVILWELIHPTRSVAFSPTGDILATSGGTTIRLWNLADETNAETILDEHTDEVLALEFSPDGSNLASAGRDDTILLWEAATGQLIDPPLRGHSTDVLTLDFSPDGKSLVSAGQGGTIVQWDLSTHRPIELPRIELHEEDVIEALFGSSGETLLLGSRDGTLITLNLESGEGQEEVLPTVQEGERIVSLALTQDGQRAAYFGELGIVKAANGERAHGIEISQWSRSFDPSVNPEDIDFILVRATIGLTTDSMFEMFLDPIQSVPIRGAYHYFLSELPWQAQADHFLSVARDQGFHFFTLIVESSLNERSAQFARGVEQWLKYVDERVEQKVLLQTTPRVYDTWLSPFGDWMKDWPLHIMQYPVEPDRNETPVLPPGVEDWRIWQYSGQNEKGAEYGVGTDGVILDTYNGPVADMWEWLDISTFSIFNRISSDLSRPKQPVQVTSLNGIAFSPDDSYLASGGEGSVSIWDGESGEVISTLPIAGLTATSVSFSPDGRILAVGTERETVLLWDLGLLDPGAETGLYLEITCSLAGRNLTQAEWNQFFPGEQYRETCPQWPPGE